MRLNKLMKINKSRLQCDNGGTGAELALGPGLDTVDVGNVFGEGQRAPLERPQSPGKRIPFFLVSGELTTVGLLVH